MLDAYLRELERELARTLPSEEVRTRLAETQAHLSEGIEGRIELGLAPAEAEREALNAFGPIGTILSPNDSKMRWLAFVAGGVFGQYLSIRYVIGHVPALTSEIILTGDVLIVLAILGFARACFRSRRPAVLSLLLAALLAFAVPVGYARGRLAGGGFGDGCRRTFVDAPAQALDGTPLRGVVEAAYEGRFLLWSFVVAPAAVDLVAASLGSLALSLRRRRAYA